MLVIGRERRRRSQKRRSLETWKLRTRLPHLFFGGLDGDVKVFLGGPGSDESDESGEERNMER
jgi:hypothetical protein